MQVTPVPVPTVPSALPPEAVAKVVPQLQAQAAAPVIQRAVDPSTRSEKGQHARSNGDKAKGGGSDDGGQRGGSVNIRV